MTALNRIRSAIDSERATLNALYEKVTSQNLKDRCQLALNRVDDAEQLWGIEDPIKRVEGARTNLELAIAQREDLEKRIEKYGADAESCPED